MTKRQALIVAVRRARRIVSAQRKLIRRLNAAGEPTLDAEQMLGTFVSALQRLEDHKRRIAEGRKLAKSEAGG
jgi:hypothetical protein